MYRMRAPHDNYVIAISIKFRGSIAAKVMATSVNKDQLERLHSRVDQQSTLIEMLKQRADKTQYEVRTICQYG